MEINVPIPLFPLALIATAVDTNWAAVLLVLTILREPYIINYILQ